MIPSIAGVENAGEDERRDSAGNDDDQSQRGDKQLVHVREAQAEATTIDCGGPGKKKKKLTHK